MKVAQKIIFNTGILYIKLFLSIILGLFTTRYVLAALGETDYGIYTVVAGVVGMLAILQSAMSNTSMRYMAHSLGSGNKDLISRTFNTTLILHFIIGLGIVVFIEIGGYFMFKYALNIPPNKMFEARVIFHLMAATSFVAIIAVPYDAVINAHENLLALSIVDIVGSVLNLGVAIWLLYLDSYLLIWYGAAVFCVQLLKRITKQVYASYKYEETKLYLGRSFDKKLTKEIMAFSGWNLLGSLAAMSVTQFRSLLLNMFFGVRMNASEGIARTATSQVKMLSTNLGRAINPQLIKSEGGGDRERMIRITIMSTKFTTFLFIIIVVPVFIELPYLLNLWLTDVPEFAVIFSRIILIGMFTEKLTFGLTNAMRAIGEIKQFQLTETIILVLNIPITYILFTFNYPAQTIYFVALFLSILCGISRLYFGKKIAKINVSRFLKEAVLPIIPPILISGIVGIFIQHFISFGFLRLTLLVFSSITLSILIFLKFGLKSNEKKLFTETIKTVLKWK